VATAVGGRRTSALRQQVVRSTCRSRWQWTTPARAGSVRPRAESLSGVRPHLVTTSDLPGRDRNCRPEYQSSFRDGDQGPGNVYTSLHVARASCCVCVEEAGTNKTNLADQEARAARDGGARRLTEFDAWIDLRPTRCQQTTKWRATRMPVPRRTDSFQILDNRSTRRKCRPRCGPQTLHS